MAEKSGHCPDFSTLIAKNTAQLFIKMERESELILNPYYSNHVEELGYNPFAALLANYNQEDENQ